MSAPAPLITSSQSLVIALLLMAGCDFLFDVKRSAPLPVPPDFTCVERVIREAPGVECPVLAGPE